uniref:Uncharacterized protein n=1 Tax=Pipistrellus kuhlii TaxID=59472 RepID=A0A7J7W3T0_PIPKU|nr:hypothetical protein mPipKuh1_008215 [Pipistrellus kuhlii]
MLGLSGFEVGGLLGLGGFGGGGLLLSLPTGPGSPAAQVATLTSGLPWPSVVWLTGPSLRDMGEGGGSSSTSSCCSLIQVELCNDSDRQQSSTRIKEQQELVEEEPPPPPHVPQRELVSHTTEGQGRPEVSVATWAAGEPGPVGRLRRRPPPPKPPRPNKPPTLKPLSPNTRRAIFSPILRLHYTHVDRSRPEDLEPQQAEPQGEEEEEVEVCVEWGKKFM